MNLKNDSFVNHGSSYVLHFFSDSSQIAVCGVSFKAVLTCGARISHDGRRGADGSVVHSAGHDMDAADAEALIGRQKAPVESRPVKITWVS
jgi:hypothetical protein